MGQAKQKHHKKIKNQIWIMTGIIVLTCASIAFIISSSRAPRKNRIPSAILVDHEMLALKEQRKNFESYALFHTLQGHEVTKLIIQQNAVQRELIALSRMPRNPDINAQIESKKRSLESLVQNEILLDQQRQQESQRIETERRRLDSLERDYQRRKNLTPEEYAAGYEIDHTELKFCESLAKKASRHDYDIAAFSMAVIKELPDTDQLNISSLLSRLDLLAKRVKSETDRHLYRYKQNPSLFSNSEAYFRILMLGTVLQEDFNVRYDPNPEKRITPQSPSAHDLSFYNDISKIFLHGLLGTVPHGTCASIPVLYVAIGRRLGYPLKLVNAKDHWFARWEDTRQKFNIECTSDKGINCHPDTEYRKWPCPISDEEMRSGMYLKSLTPNQELAALLNLRAICLAQTGRKNTSLTCKLYADELLLAEGIDLLAVNKGLAKQAKSQPPQHTTTIPKETDIPIVAIEWFSTR